MQQVYYFGTSATAKINKRMVKDLG